MLLLGLIALLLALLAPPEAALATHSTCTYKPRTSDYGAALAK
jgi:hypothetical protein